LADETANLKRQVSTLEKQLQGGQHDLSKVDSLCHDDTQTMRITHSNNDDDDD